jgi:DNA polymerase-1
MEIVLNEAGITPGRTPKSNKAKVNRAVLQDAYERTGDERFIVSDEIRSLKKMIDTFIQGYVLDNADSNSIVRGEFHPLRSEKYGTVSGRYSSGGHLNLQNLPARDGRYGPMIRSLFVPFEGCDWVKIDYSQIEYRFLAHYAGGTIARKFIEDPTVDFHQMVADMIGWPGKAGRDAAKNINFGIVYGMGKEKLARSLGVGINEAEEILIEYNKRAREIKKLYYLAQNRAASRGYIRTWRGRVRRYPRIRLGDGRTFDKTHGALNGLLQGSAADLIKEAMILADQIVDWKNSFMHFTIHDELDFSVPKGADGERTIRELKAAMESFRINVPIIAEVERGSNWGKKSDSNPKGLIKWQIGTNERKPNTPKSKSISKTTPRRANA